MPVDTQDRTDKSRKRPGIDTTNRENCESISPFDLLRQRLNMPDAWISPETAAVAKQEITPRLINRILKRVWMGLELGLTAVAVKPSRLVTAKGALKQWQL